MDKIVLAIRPKCLILKKFRSTNVMFYRIALNFIMHYFEQKSTSKKKHILVYLFEKHFIFIELFFLIWIKNYSDPFNTVCWNKAAGIGLGCVFPDPMPVSVSVYTGHTLQCTLCIHCSGASVAPV